MESVKYQRLALQNIQTTTKNYFIQSLKAICEAKQCALESVNALMGSNNNTKKYLIIITVVINDTVGIAYSHETEIVEKRMKML